MTAVALPRARPAAFCPDHPYTELIPCPGGAARGMCPVDCRTHQMETPEVTA
jgi:hypothetical protein